MNLLFRYVKARVNVIYTRLGGPPLIKTTPLVVALVLLYCLCAESERLLKLVSRKESMFHTFYDWLF